MSNREAIMPAGHETAYERFQLAPAFRVGDTLYVSGVIGRGAQGHVPEDVRAEYAAVFDGLAKAVAAAGPELADLVEMTSFHTDFPDTVGPFMKAMSEALTTTLPAWAAIGCTTLAAQGARVEVKATAVLKSKPA